MLNVEADEEVFKNSIVYVPGTAIQDYMANEYWKQFEIILTNDNRVEDWEEVAGEEWNE